MRGHCRSLVRSAARARDGAVDHWRFSGPSPTGYRRCQSQFVSRWRRTIRQRPGDTAIAPGGRTGQPGQNGRGMVRRSAPRRRATKSSTDARAARRGATKSSTDASAPVAVLPNSRPMPEPEPKSKLDLPPSTPINPVVIPPSNARAATPALQSTPQPDQTPAQGPGGSENQQAVTAPPAVSQPVSANVLLGFATLIGFAPVGWAFRRLRRRARQPHLALWQVVPRSDPGRQWIASRDDPIGPVFGLRITHAGPAAELSWAKEEARHV